MSNRKIPLIEGEYYHIFNRGVDKRDIFCDEHDVNRFLLGMKEFNSTNPIGSIFENNYKKDKQVQPRLVNVICYCLNPNHYHMMLLQLEPKGIEKFMHRIGTGYTKYFNEKYKRSGSLFQGRFKSVHIETNEQLLYLSAYINLNDKAHQLGSSTSKGVVGSRSSWKEYESSIDGFCDKAIIMAQFSDVNDYKKYSKDALVVILENKKRLKKNEENIYLE